MGDACEVLTDESDMRRATCVSTFRLYGMLSVAWISKNCRFNCGRSASDFFVHMPVPELSTTNETMLCVIIVISF